MICKLKDFVNRKDIRRGVIFLKKTVKGKQNFYFSLVYLPILW